MYDNKISIVYRDEQSLSSDNGYSKSPLKPKLLLDWLQQNDLLQYFTFDRDWGPFEESDFLIAHTQEYVTNFFRGIEPECSTNGLDWSPEFAETVKYTNASLYNAIRQAILRPEVITFSPTSGFHHAQPNEGSGYCTFSGQVISSLKILKKFGLSGSYVDLDGHFGNSIEDSRDFCKDLNRAVPIGFNINPKHTGKRYLANLFNELYKLRVAILDKKIDYVVVCSGADSLKDDDMGSQLSLEEWLEAKRMVYSMIQSVTDKLGKPFPLILTLFGGYREKHFDSVLDAHTQDLIMCSTILGQNKISYDSKYLPRS